MKIADSWLKKYITTDLSTEKISEYLTDIGLEVEGADPIESIKGSLEGIVVGNVLTCEKHPNADKLSITTVNLGNENIVQIVCGAPNVAAGQTVPVATVGTKIYDAAGSFFEIKEAKIRGEKSVGMICAEDELGIGESHEGIMVLDPAKFEVGEAFSKYFDVEKDIVYEIGLTPNRTDAMSHYGVARDLNAYLASNEILSSFKKLENIDLKTSGAHDFKIVVEDENLCPRYLGAVVDNLKIEESPAWLKNKLKAIGLGAINNVVDITNYILHSFGQPLHAFDAKKIAGNTVKVGVSISGSKFTTLDGVERTLNGSEIMIKDGNDLPMCIAGVFGGAQSGVSNDTTSIFLESAYFNPIAVRKAAKSHGLNTDASFRFERGVDPELTKIALSQAIEMLVEIAGGNLKGEILEFYPTKIESNKVSFRFTKLDEILGATIPKEKVIEILKNLEIEILSENDDVLELDVPAYRADVTREIDVIEEVLRIFGYNKIHSPKKISFSPVKVKLEDQDEMENTFARSLQSLGFNEVMNNSLTSVKDETDVVKILNPLSKELSFMRKSLLEGLLQNADYNIKRKSSDIKFFELGKIYHKKEHYEERKQLGLLITGRNAAENWLVPQSTSTFFNMKAYVKLLLSRFNFELEEIKIEDERFSDGLALITKGKTIARMGIVSGDLLKMYDLAQECFYAEIELETVQSLRDQIDLKFKDISKFNVLRRDLALLVDQDVEYAALHSVASKVSKLIKNINLFDVYEGKNLPEGKKSYALSFELLDEQKTLEEKEISAVMQKLIKTFEKDFGAVLR